jgi:hypothetical protein
MTAQNSLLVITLLSIFQVSFCIKDKTWFSEKCTGFDLYYNARDRENKKEYMALLESGKREVQTFFNSNFRNSFDVYIHPNRHSLDSAWQSDWKIADFKSECWMVASGIAAKLDIVSPKRWEKEACEHNYFQTEKTQQLITHELIHVFHGQLNASPDFSDVDGLDWFVEGLATYASGQCDSLRIAQVRGAIADGKIPNSLDDFWTGKLKYGLAGSVVMFIDERYGRKILIDLLPFNKKTDLLAALKISESELIREWKTYISSL